MWRDGDGCDVDFEDAFRPIAYIGEDLFLFNASDGVIYQIGSALAPRTESLPRQVFAVPGDENVYSMRVSAGVLRVKRHHLVDRRRKDEIILGRHGEASPIGVIACGSDRHVVLRVAGESQAVFVSLRTGKTVTHRLPLTARPLFVREDGHVVYQQGGLWGTTSGDGTPEPGIVTSWSHERFIVASDAKGHRDYMEIAGGDRRTLDAPEGWEVRQAVTFSGNSLLVCLHPSLGYAIWQNQRLARVEGTAIAYALGNHEPVIRTTSYAAGSAWRVGSRMIPGIIGRKSGVRIRATVINGCPSVHVTSETASGRLLVAFHGGPDSLEWDDLRYGGMYRGLLDHGIDVLIVNYAGSQGFGAAHQRRAWRAWDRTLASLGRHIRAFRESHGYVHLDMLGVSFGAWAALIAAAHALPERIVLASPLLRLAAHLRRHEDDVDFREWGEARFGSTLDAECIDDMTYAGVRAEVTAIVPSEDRTIDVRDTLATCRAHGWIPVEVPGGHYPATLEHARIRWQALAHAVIHLSKA